MKRPLKIIGIIVVVLIVVVIAIPFFVDVDAFRSKIESELSTALGRQIAWGTFIFNYSFGKRLR
jgi:AsmA protein